MGGRITADDFMHVLYLHPPSDELFSWYKKLKVVCKDWYKAVEVVFSDKDWLKPFMKASHDCVLRIYDISTFRTDLTAEDITFVTTSMILYRTVQDVQSYACCLLANISNSKTMKEHLQTANVAALVLAAMRTCSVAENACSALHALCFIGLVEGTAVTESLVQINRILEIRPIDYDRSVTAIHLLTAMLSDEMLAAMSKDGFVASIVPHIQHWQNKPDADSTKMHNQITFDGLRFLRQFSVVSTYNRVRVCDEGGMRIAVAALHTSQKRMTTKVGLEVLDALLSSTDTDNSVVALHIIEAGGAPALKSVAAEATTDEWLQRECLDTVRIVQGNLCRRVVVTVS